MNLQKAIEESNFQLALKLVDKQLAKNDSTHLKVQKLFIQAHLNPVTPPPLTPSDPKTIILLLATYAVLGTPAPSIWEDSIRKYSTGQLVLDWNSWCLETGDVLAWQKATMTMRKLTTGRNDEISRSVSWRSVMAIVTVLDTTTKGGKFLGMLAGRIIDELPDPVGAEQHWLVVKVLLSIGKKTEAISLLENFLNKEQNLELWWIMMDLFDKEQLYDKIWNWGLKYLQSVDDWEIWKLMIKSSEHLDKNAELWSLIDESKTTRNTALAKIQASDDKLTMIINYISLFGHKQCCFLDLKSLIKESLNDKAQLWSLIQEKFIKMGEPTNINEFTFLINYLKFKTLLTDALSDSQFSSECLNYYKSTKHLHTPLPEYDLHPSSDLIILAVHSLLLNNKHSSHLYFECINLLESAIVSNPYEFHLKIWLAILYTNYNQPSLAIGILNDLKIKNLQLDTCGPLFLQNAMRSPALLGLSLQTHEQKDISELLDSIKKLYKSADRELYPSVMACIDSETWSKLPGFLTFKNRLTHSLTRYYTTILELQMSLITNKKMTDLEDKLTILREFISLSPPGIENVDADDHVCDNIDLHTIWDCGTHESLDLGFDLGVKYEWVRCWSILLLISLAPYTNERTKHLLNLRKLVHATKTLTPIEKWGMLHYLGEESDMPRLSKMDYSTLALFTKLDGKWGKYKELVRKFINSDIKREMRQQIREDSNGFECKKLLDKLRV
ncbi:hypothetical protein DAMA08_002920 [Martiniozyma asiatica (nom. inval.)]|nr:hypothetical protein DAMA08_002920 [Martiniozyma asiatica]